MLPLPAALRAVILDGCALSRQPTALGTAEGGGAAQAQTQQQQGMAGGGHARRARGRTGPATCRRQLGREK